MVHMIYSWASRHALKEARTDVKIGEKMGINVYQWCRDICSWKLISGPPIQLGGPGSIVQIDESVFTHQGKVNKCTKSTSLCCMHQPCMCLYLCCTVISSILWLYRIYILSHILSYGHRQCQHSLYSACWSYLNFR